ncbi:MAG: hypothetical protein M3384_21035 [Acidobacteriota bacterium]|nr:hypothetical protein [Acidobacteriota bacterium]
MDSVDMVAGRGSRKILRGNNPPARRALGEHAASDSSSPAACPGRKGFSRHGLKRKGSERLQFRAFSFFQRSQENMTKESFPTLTTAVAL